MGMLGPSLTFPYKVGRADSLGNAPIGHDTNSSHLVPLSRTLLKPTTHRAPPPF
jgi:hypothetical protein